MAVLPAAMSPAAMSATSGCNVSITGVFHAPKMATTLDGLCCLHTKDGAG